MTMLRPGGKAKKIAKKVMRGQNVKLPSTKKIKKSVLEGPYLEH